jgi:hypothetical protein
MGLTRLGLTEQVVQIRGFEMSEIYYLSSLDYYSFVDTRECVFIKEMFFPTGHECVLARVDPVVIGQPFGLGGNDIAELVLSCRHPDVYLFPVSEFPCFVHIARPLIGDIESRDQITVQDIEHIAWGELYRTRYDADNHVFEPRPHPRIDWSDYDFTRQNP